jgi:hypothetical protein
MQVPAHSITYVKAADDRSWYLACLWVLPYEQPSARLFS